jgi:hypothetical protein
VDNCIAYIFNKHIEEQGSQDRENFRRWAKTQKHGFEISGWLGNCETSLRSHQKAQKHQVYEKAENVEQGRMHCLDQNKWHQLDSESD